MFLRVSLNFSAAHVGYFFLFAIVSGLIPSFCFFRAVTFVQASVAGIILLFEPVVASLIGWSLFHQSLDGKTILGAALILLSNYLS